MICEGLLPYLDQGEKWKMAKSIHHFLCRHGGVWITTDIYSSDRMSKLIELDPKVGEVMKVLAGKTGRDLRANAFGSISDAESFYSSIGFKIKKWSQATLVPRLMSAEKNDVDLNKMVVIMEHSHIWMLEPK
jgi:hypothetical protein